MSKTTQRERVTAAILHERVSAIIRTRVQQLAHDAMDSAVAGGFRIVEFTLTTPGALELITTFSARDGLTVGAGTVMTPDSAGAAVAAGAKFLVSPITDREVIAEADRLDVPIIPGAYTPSEMEAAHRYGADFVKVFPAPAGGITFFEAVLAPLPHLRLFPTAGPTPANFLEYLDAGCSGVGFVRSLFDPADLASGNFDAIRARSADVARRLSAWRSRRSQSE